MIKNSKTIRPGMTAIAAVIALSSTPLLAQDAAPQSTAPAATPVQVTPPPVVRTAPANDVPTSITTLTPQPAVPVAAPPAPVVDTAPAAPAAAAPVQAEPEAAPAAPVARAERRAPAATRAPRTAAPEAAPTAAPVAQAPTAQADSAPLDVTPPAAAVAATPAPAAEPVPVTTDAVANQSDTLPLIGAGALAVLALGAAGFALTRRRRRDNEFADEWATADAAPAMAEAPAEEPAVVQPVRVEEPVVAPQPAPVAAAPAPALATAAAPVAEGEDGRHVQAAHAGPTPENPFVSLKKRLKRAHFLDMQEAREAEQGIAPAATAQAARRAPVQPDRYEVRRPAPAPRRPAIRPAFQG